MLCFSCSIWVFFVFIYACILLVRNNITYTLMSTLLFFTAHKVNDYPPFPQNRSEQVHLLVHFLVHENFMSWYFFWWRAKPATSTVWTEGKELSTCFFYFAKSAKYWQDKSSRTSCWQTRESIYWHLMTMYVQTI